MAIPGNDPVGITALAQQLASVPDIPKKRGLAGGDGAEPGFVPNKPKDGTPGTDDGVQDSPFGPTGPTIADVDAKVRWQAIEMLVRSQDRLARNRWNVDTHFDRLYRGVPFSRLEKIPNQSIWVAKLPNGMTKEAAGSTPNKAQDLCNKVADSLMADPPKLICHPPTNDAQAEQAAEFATDFLREDGGESGTNDLATERWAMLGALIRAATFTHYLVDPDGGGYQPLQVLAHPEAQDPANPLVAMRPIPGAPPGPDGQPPMMEDVAVNPVLRYVSAPDERHPAGQFVEEAMQADRVWLPKHKVERLRREQVRMFPPSVPIEEARAVILIRWMTLGDAMHEWPDTVGRMSNTELQGLASWRPAMSEMFVVPYALRALAEGQSGPMPEVVGTLSPLLTRRMYSYRLYVKASPEYPEGYWCDSSGANGGMDLASGTLEYEVETPAHGKIMRCRDIPVVQWTPMQDVTDGDPMGWPFISRFAGASEAEATIWAAALDRLDNELHPHVIIPSTTAVDADDWADRTVPIVVNPDAQPVTYEQFPPFPPVLSMVDKLDQKQDVASGLTETAQGLDNSSSVSGVAKNLTIQQAKVYLSQFQQAYLAAKTRAGRIKLQNTQAFYTVPQLVQFSGEEGSSGPRYWTGTDMAGVDSLGIQPGTGTMMTPEGKAQYVSFLQSQQWMDAEQASDTALPGIKADLGIPENPVEQALERQIGMWLQGPPEGWLATFQQEKAQYDAAVQQAQMAHQQVSQQAAQMGQPAPAMPPLPPFQPSVQNPFAPKPNDTEPKVAMATVKKLSRLMFDPEYEKQPPEWRSLVDQKYMGARQVLTPPAPPPGAPPQADGRAHPPAQTSRPVPAGTPQQHPPKPVM